MGIENPLAKNTLISSTPSGVELTLSRYSQSILRYYWLLIYNVCMKRIAIENDGTKVRLLLMDNDGNMVYKHLPRGITDLDKLKEYEDTSLSSN